MVNTQLSNLGNHAAFKIPFTTIGAQVCRFPLFWGWHIRKEYVQPLIDSPLVHYTGFRRATPEEILTYTPTPHSDRDNKMTND